MLAIPIDTQSAIDEAQSMGSQMMRVRMVSSRPTGHHRHNYWDALQLSC
jgi:hypothetical protein